MRTFSDRLADHRQIRSHLRKLPENYTGLDIKIDNQPVQFRSFYLGFSSPAEKEIIIDGLIPVHGNVNIEDSSKITVSYLFGDIAYVFTSGYLETIEDRFTSFRISMPDTIRRFQRRKAFRVVPSVATPISVQLGSGDDEEVANISTGGMCFYTWRPIEDLEVGRNLYDITFNLPSEKHDLKIKAVVRAYTKNQVPTLRGVRSKCSVEFVGLNHELADVIRSYVMDRHQENSRKNHTEFF
ncbi:MAG: hypothetical protein IEMM0002_1287 [bacterium]|nr:MAG: hypothetical protein IEMM0002_1287 [bacterium]